MPGTTKQVQKAKKLVEQAGYEIKTLAEYDPIEFVTTGISEVDKLVKFPRGRITEIYGPYGVGKTHLMSKCVAAISKEAKVLYLDAENAINPDRLRELGASPKNVLIAHIAMLEDAAEYVIAKVSQFDVVIVDSIASLIPKSELEGQVGDQFVMLKARLMGQWMRRLVPILGKTRCACVFINQLRESPNVYVPKFTPGGKALTYAASLRLELSYNKSSRYKAKDSAGWSGHTVKVEITKSKICKPYQETEFKLEY